MNKDFKNMEELKEYLNSLEERINKIENENFQLIKRNSASKLPKTNIVSPNFLKRAFSVWGHAFTAQLIISLTLGSIYFCLTIFAINSLLSSIRVTDNNNITPTPAIIVPPIP